MTHTLEVLHTLQWHHPGGRAVPQLAQASTQDYHSYTHALLDVVEDEVTSPNGSAVRVQENTELLAQSTGPFSHYIIFLLFFCLGIGYISLCIFHRNGLH